MKPQANINRSPVAKGIYRVPVEYQMVLEVALRTMRVRSKDDDWLRKIRMMRSARKWALTTARAIRGEVKGWLEVYPQYKGSTWAAAVEANRTAAEQVIKAIADKQGDLEVAQHIEALIESLNGNNPTTT